MITLGVNESVTDDLPNLAALAKPLIYSAVNLADAERSFCIYKLILSLEDEVFMKRI